MEFTITSKAFADLSVSEFYQIAQLRVAVFVVEQNCPYQEIDELDPVAWHVWLTAEDGEIAAYGRVYEKQGSSHLGRVLVNKAYRGQHLGNRLVEELLAVAQEQFPQVPVVIGAQAHLQKFYGSFGFQPVSEVYLEDGIPHIQMRREP